MTKLEISFLYRADWAWQRGEEALLGIRFYWWCVQCATFVVLPIVVRRYGLWTLVLVLVDAYDWRYRYEERHSWQNTEEEPRSSWELVAMLREETRQRNRVLFLGSFDAPPRSDTEVSRIVKGTPLSPLMDRDPNPWPTVQGRATVVYATENNEPDTALLIPHEWAEERIKA